MCVIRSSILSWNPYRVYSELEHDAWAAAFDVLRDALRIDGKTIVDADGQLVALPSPPRDHSWVPPLHIPDVTGIEPIYRVECWAKRRGREKRRVELAIWPPFEKVPGTFCAPIKCTLRSERPLICSYGAFPEQAVYLAYAYLRIETEAYDLTDDEGRPIVIPTPPEPPLPEAW